MLIFASQGVPLSFRIGQTLLLGESSFIDFVLQFTGNLTQRPGSLVHALLEFVCGYVVLQELVFMVFMAPFVLRTFISYLVALSAGVPIPPYPGDLRRAQSG